jgi:hypothetical protein
VLWHPLFTAIIFSISSEYIYIYFAEPKMGYNNRGVTIIGGQSFKAEEKLPNKTFLVYLLTLLI